MKKTIIISLMLLTLVSQVFSVNGDSNSNQNKQNELVTAGNILAEQEQTRERNQEQLKVGLDNALEKVKNTQARERLQNNIKKFEENLEERLVNMEEVQVIDVDEETGEATIRVKEQVKLLGFLKIRVRKEFKLTENNQIQEQRRWFDGFVKQIK